MSQIYFDHAATTSMVEPAIKALTENATQLGNASSLHSAGRNVRKNLEQAREEIAAIADCLPSEIIFTASGTEANNLAIKGLYWRARNIASPAGPAGTRSSAVRWNTQSALRAARLFCRPTTWTR
ncbi:MAG: hypothetical protein RLZZ378_915, partial [Actinomycetota bacterium]